jgi:aldose sugar dehydrogenase
MKSILILTLTLLVTIGSLLCIYIDGFFAVLEKPYLYHIQIYRDLFAIAEPLFSKLNSTASFGSSVYGDSLTSKDNEPDSTVHQFDIGSGDWNIEDPAILSSSLRIDVKKGNATNWSVVSTDFIPAIADSAYNFSLDIVAADVNQLHTKVYSYDSNKDEIDSKIVSLTMDGTFNKTFADIFYTPSDTSYIKLQLWVRPNPQIDSYYIIESNKNIISGPIGFSVAEEAAPIPVIQNPNLRAELIVDSLNEPVTMDFAGPGDFLLTDREGSVIRVISGTSNVDTLLDISNISTEDERGMLGIAVHKESDKNLVFLYYTEKIGDSVKNRLYKYELQDGELRDPQLLLDLPALPGPDHNGGAITIGPDENIYVTVGDLRNSSIESDQGKTRAQNSEDAPDPDGRAGILRVTIEGKHVMEGIIGSEYPLNLYYAYGIRNSFGIDMDPVTGNLWDAENGPAYGDEINLVKPGFNSGWDKIQGVWYNNGFLNGTRVMGQPNTLVNFGGNGSYSSPEFVWNHSVGVTDIAFLDSDMYGSQLKNDLLVADYNNGNIYHFDLNKDRTGLLLEGELADTVANSNEELEPLIFAQGFGPITDLDVGPDGYLYIVSGVRSENGSIYRIVPTW